MSRHHHDEPGAHRSRWYGAGPGTLPAYSSFDGVTVRLRERRARRWWWRADGRAYNLLGHLVVTLVVLAACFTVLWLGVRFAATDLAVLVLVCGALAWYWRGTRRPL